VRPAPLPGRAGQHRGDRVPQPLVAVGGDQLHAGQAAGGQAAQERQPSRAVLGARDVQAEDFPLAIGVDPGRDQGVHVHRPAALADLLGQRVDPHERIRPGVQRPRAEAAHHLIQFGGHDADLGLAQLRHAEGLGELLHPAGADAKQAGRGDDGGQGPLRAAAPLQQPLRVIRAFPQLGDRHLDGPRPGVPVPAPVAVTGVHPVWADLAIRRAAQLFHFGVHHPLREPLDHLPQQIRARGCEGLLEPHARNRHNVTYGHLVLLRLVVSNSKDHEVAASRHADTPTQDETVTTEQAPHTPLPWT